MEQKFEEQSKEQLAENLRRFYGTVLSKNGKEYSKSGMINIRSGLNRHLTNPPYKRTIDLMQDPEFLQANKVLTGRLRDNKEKGLDTSKLRPAIEKEDVEKLFNNYFKVGLAARNTQVLLHKMFFDIVYYTGRRGKEGLRNLLKSSFQLKVGPDGVEYLEMTYNEKTKKNQGDSTSASVDALHNDRNIISAQGGELCPVETYKIYTSLLNKDLNAFFQYPSDDKKYFTAKVVGKNTIGTLMSEISTQAGLSKTYPNHAIRKTTVTAMKRSGFSLQDIANVTKHKNLDSLKHYMSAPTHQDKERYVSALHNYGCKNVPAIAPRPQQTSEHAQASTPPPRKIPRQDASAPKVNIIDKNNENVAQENCVVPMYYDESDSNTSLEAMPKQQNTLQNVLNNQLRQTSQMFQNATFNNCQFSFNLPK